MNTGHELRHPRGKAARNNYPDLNVLVLGGRGLQLLNPDPTR